LLGNHFFPICTGKQRFQLPGTFLKYGYLSSGWRMVQVSLPSPTEEQGRQVKDERSKGSDIARGNGHYLQCAPLLVRDNSPCPIAARTILGGWEFSGVTIAQSGTPQPLTYNGVDTLGLGGNTTNRPNQLAPVRYLKKRTAWFDTSTFTSPLAPWNGGTGQGFGTAGKDAVVLPGRVNFNLSLFKTIEFKPEGLGLELRFESFNTFNHTQFHGIDSGSTDPNFGQITSAYDPRVLQLGAKLHF